MKAYLEIEMPKSCCECSIKSWDGEDNVCPFSGISALNIGRQNDCPLVPVPPHGRLIDADAAIVNRNKDTNWCYDLCDLPEYLADCPTIIPAEEGET